MDELNPSTETDFGGLDPSIALFGVDGLDQPDATQDLPLPTDAAVETSDTEPQEKVDEPQVEEQTAAPAEDAPGTEKKEETVNATEESKSDLDSAKETVRRHTFDPTYPKAKWFDELEKVSPSLARDITYAGVKKEIERNPVGFAQSVFDQSPENYAQIISAALSTSPEYFAKQFLGREATREQLTEALDFYEKYKDRAEQLTGDEFDWSKLDSEEFQKAFADIKEFDPVFASLLEKAISGAKLTAQENAELKSKLQPEQKTDEPAKEETQQVDPQKEINDEILSIWDSGDDRPSVTSLVHGHLQKALADTYKLIPTEAEREATPVLAGLKDLKRNLLLYGDGESFSDFKDGFGEWGKTNKDVTDDFTKVLGDTADWSNRRERQNALDAAKGFLPLADKYMEARLEHPLVKLIDSLLEEAATKLANSTVKQDEPVTAGSPKISNQVTNSIEDMIISEAVKAANNA